MTDLFEEDEVEVVDVVDDFDEVDLELDTSSVQGNFPDARRRLESLLDEKRLQNEIEDYLDF